MRSQEQAHSVEQDVSEQSLPQSPAKSLDTPARQHTAPSPLIQRTQIDARSLSTGNVLQLQRTLGNQAMGRLVTGARTLQKTADDHSAAHRAGSEKESKTGLPSTLKAGAEHLSGMALDDVKVHYDSDKPAQVQAFAYTQGTEIHIAPGQERHLPHEAWHVVQQAQGRVRPTMQMKGGVQVNDDSGLEHEADVMGARALRMQGEPHDAKHVPVVIPSHHAIVMRAKKVAKPEPDEKRPETLKNETIETVDGTKLTYDPFDLTITAILPDGKGLQVRYTFEKKSDDEKKEGGEEKKEGDEPAAPVARVAHVEELSPMRVKALGFLDTKQGTLQETKAGLQTRTGADHAKGEAARTEWLKIPINQQEFNDYKQALTAYATTVAELPKGAKKPPPPPAPKSLPGDPRTTLCNNFPLEMGSVVGPKGDSGQLANFDPAVEGEKRKSWRTLKEQPGGPKPGDIYSLANAKNRGKIEHLGIFKSSRPGPNDLQIWTVVDGGQGSYDKMQQILERTRYYNSKTGILSTKMADAGQSADDRWLRGWIDIEEHFKKPEEKKTDTST
jgi:hypothetical protein